MRIESEVDGVTCRESSKSHRFSGNYDLAVCRDSARPKKVGHELQDIQYVVLWSIDMTPTKGLL
jgi:hypothetical protein